MYKARLTEKQYAAIKEIGAKWFTGCYSLEQAESEYARTMYNVFRRYKWFKAMSDMEKSAFMHDIKQRFAGRLIKAIGTAINNA